MGRIVDYWRVDTSSLPFVDDMPFRVGKVRGGDGRDGLSKAGDNTGITLQGEQLIGVCLMKQTILQDTVFGRLPLQSSSVGK
jgi:hypothetical protein